MATKESGIDVLIEALTILKKYGDGYAPTNCQHDVLSVCCGITEEDVSPEDKARLTELGFFWSSEYDSWCSFRFGSC